MGRAKDIIIKPIAVKDANRIIKQLHYSGKHMFGTTLNFGVYLDNKCGGALQFGTSVDKRKVMPLVKGTGWRQFIELQRMALADWLPRNSESRALGYVIRTMKKKYSHLKWILSYADATQCGDGGMYRAVGFILTAITKNRSMWRLPSGEVVAEFVTRQLQGHSTRKRIGFQLGETWKGYAGRVGAELLDGHQLRYIYFLDPSYRERLTVPEIPYSKIDEMGIGMYKGIKRTPGRGGSAPTESDGAIPIRPLQLEALPKVV